MNHAKRYADTLKAYREAVAQQAATADILKVTGSFPADVQAVFDAIVRRAARLFAPCIRWPTTRSA